MHLDSLIGLDKTAIPFCVEILARCGITDFFEFLAGLRLIPDALDDGRQHVTDCREFILVRERTMAMMLPADTKLLTFLLSAIGFGLMDTQGNPTLVNGHQFAETLLSYEPQRLQPV
jgi:hypothetical protein